MDCRKKLLIDTDIGDDIDDAFALLSAISLGFDIVGITTVFKSTEERARMTKKLLSFFSGYENVPIFAGEGTPMAENADEYPHLCQYTSDLDNDEYEPDGDNAVDFIAECCRKYGRNLIIASIGPFTNIARVIDSYPGVLDLAERIVIMGGSYFRQYADWNVMCDVEGAELMFSSLSNLECIGADVTHRLIPSPGLIAAVERSDISHPGLKYLQELYKMWQEANDNPSFVLHDALVMHYIADSSLCEFETGHVEVITKGAARGLTLNTEAYKKTYMNPYYSDAGLNPEVRLARDVDVDKFSKKILKNILKYSG